jgi:hypothetical protein
MIGGGKESNKLITEAANKYSNIRIPRIRDAKGCLFFDFYYYFYLF